MTFLSTDLYTTSGDAKVLKTWTQFVQKYDSSSFYNWEQDNIPLYDLEDRTNYLWEHAGYPASSCPGLAFAVSSTAQQVDLDCNPNLFSTVSAAIAGLPRVLRFPVLIEVASFGNLGKLELNNITCEDGGSLEIVNRNFSKLYSASSLVVAGDGGGGITGVAAAVSSLDASNTLYYSSALALGGGGARDGTVFSSIAAQPEGLNTHNRVVWQPAGFTITNASGSLVKTRTNRLVCNPTSRTNLVNDKENIFSLSAIYDDGASDATIAKLDASSYHQGTDLLLSRQDNGWHSNAVGMIYGNYLRKVKIENCVGPIFIRNFVVDGTGADTATQAVQSTEIGIEVNNSNIILENCTAERCSDAGIQFNNSKITVTRGLVGYRNYKMNGAASRDTSSLGAGIRLVNSDVTLSAYTDPQTTKGVDFILHFAHNDVGIDMINSKLHGGITRPSGGNAESITYLQASYNGRSSGNTNPATMASSTAFGAGINLTNSHLDFDGRVDVWNNTRGIVSDNSKLFLDECTLDFNMYEGLAATNSFIQYNKNKLDLMGAAGDAINADSNYAVDQFYCSGNGQHIVLDHSKLLPAEVSSMPTNTGRMLFRNSHGVDLKDAAASGNTLPSIELRNGSEAELVHALIMTLGSVAGFTCTEAIFGAGIAATNGSTARMKGSNTRATIIFGPSTFALQRNTAGVYAENGSEINFAGPTAITRFGVNALAENNATISFTPHRNRFGDIEGHKWNLGDYKNHTSVDLHSTRACLVANKNSTIDMEDLGHYRSTWGPVDVSNVDYHPPGGTDTSAWTFGGAMQFYPNPDDSTLAEESPDFRARGVVQGTTTHEVTTGDRVFSQTSKAWTSHGNSNTSKWSYFTIDPMAGGSDFTELTWGGVCVQAANNSTINVRNVHFPTGWSNTSSIVYDGVDTCAQTRIWIMSDQSHLNCAYTSVSGLYPASATYHGPGTAYTSGNATHGIGLASGAPPLHPTGPLSLLDYFGGHGEGEAQASGAIGAGLIEPPLYEDVSGVYTGDAGVVGLGSSSGVSWPDNIRNKGPFRLYFSVHPVAKQLLVSPSGCIAGMTGGPADLSSAWTTSGVFGPVWQIFAQGYNLSSNVSSAPSISELYPEVIAFTPTNLMNTSGTFRWWDCNEVVDDAYMRVMLDESAANTFANAKNASLGIGNKPKLVSIYRSTNVSGGEDFDTDSPLTAGFGRGLRSSNIFDLRRGNIE